MLGFCFSRLTQFFWGEGYGTFYHFCVCGRGGDKRFQFRCFWGLLDFVARSKAQIKRKGIFSNGQSIQVKQIRIAKNNNTPFEKIVKGKRKGRA